MPQKYLTVGGVATLVHHRGPTTLPGKPPDTSGGETILCLHDAGGNGGVFSELMDELAGAHSPISFDQPGHGRSGNLDSLGDIATMANHAKAVAAELGIGEPILIGDGMGAAVALEATSADPSWPKAVVLFGGATAAYDIDAELVDRLRLTVAGKARREFDSTGYAPDTPKDVYQRAFGEWLKTDPRATLGDREAQVGWDISSRLGDVTCPVLVIVGEHEEPDSKAAAQALGAELPNATTAELAGAGRRGLVEQPKALAAAIDRFLS